ncbi:MAG TPA: sugar ABC transporter substrate-binding protein [Burkholderiaceae bacterium]|nr:sugar ABC transporter substrate-binding protein [Burkholderiaceae bacterium]
MTRARWARWLSTAFGLMLCACSRPDHELVFWAMGRESEVVAELLPEFERTHPGVHVALHQLPWSGAHAKLLTAFVGDATPDVAQLGNTWIPELVELHALDALGPRLQHSAAVRPSDYFDGIWDTNVIDGVPYGVPWYVDTRLLFYRSDLLKKAGFDAPPEDWKQWRRTLAAIKQQAGAERYSILLPLNEFEPLTALALQQGEPLLRDGGGRGNFDSAGFRRALGFYVEMFDRGWAPPVSNTQISNVWDEFGRGYYAYYISGPWNIGEFRRRLPPERSGDWMTAPLPGPDGPGASIAGGSSLVIFAASPRKAQAWQLIEYLSRPDVQERFRALTGDLPPRRSAWDLPALAADPYARAFRQQLERARPAPKVPEWEHIEDQLRLVGELAATGQITVDQAVRELDRRVDAILEKRRWMLARRPAQGNPG